MATWRECATISTTTMPSMMSIASSMAPHLSMSRPLATMPPPFCPSFKNYYKHNANLEIKATIGRNVPDMTPLHFACAFDKTELALAMMEAGANVHALDGHGQTPLIRAVQNRNEIVIDSLLSHGADATIATSRGATPLILLADFIPEDEEGSQVDWDKDARIAKKMMNANVNVNAVDEDGLSALHWAAQSGHAQLASVLLNEGRQTWIFKTKTDKLHYS